MDKYPGKEIYCLRGEEVVTARDTKHTCDGDRKTTGFQIVVQSWIHDYMKLSFWTVLLIRIAENIATIVDPKGQ
jgi:hypothetical protein